MIFAALLLAMPARAQTPPFSLDPNLSEKDLEQVSPHVWVVMGFPNIGIVVGTRATLVIDSGLGPRNGALLAGIARRLSSAGQTLYLTTTNFRGEHASGAAGFPAGTTTLIRPRTQQAEMDAEDAAMLDTFRARTPAMKALLEDVRTSRAADILFDREYRLDLGGVEARLLWYGTGHTRGDEFVMVAPDKVLFAGDVVQNRIIPDDAVCATCTPAARLAILENLAALKPDLIVPDHGARGGFALIGEEQALLARLESRTRALKAEGKSAEEAGRIIMAEFAEAHPGWFGYPALALHVQRIYDEPR